MLNGKFFYSYADCHHAECRGVKKLPFILSIRWLTVKVARTFSNKPIIFATIGINKNCYGATPFCLKSFILTTNSPTCTKSQKVVSVINQFFSRTMSVDEMPLDKMTIDKMSFTRLYT